MQDREKWRGKRDRKGGNRGAGEDMEKIRTENTTTREKIRIEKKNTEYRRYERKK